MSDAGASAAERQKRWMMKDGIELWGEVLIELLPTEHGGRTQPLDLCNDHPGTYRPHIRLRSGELLGVEFMDGPDEPVEPGKRTHATVRFLNPDPAPNDELVVGCEFAILEGPRVVGRGRITRRWRR